MTETIEPAVVFNMDLANGSTTARFCYEAASVLELEVSDEDRKIIDAYEARDFEGGEFADEVCDEWTSKLEAAGYAVWWNAGDVVVFDVRPLTDEQRQDFFETLD